jgi:hypothetical protein
MLGIHEVSWIGCQEKPARAEATASPLAGPTFRFSDPIQALNRLDRVLGRFSTVTGKPN